LHSGAPAIDVRDVLVRFGTKTALNRVTLSVGFGRVCGLVGQNGAGKSTLIRALAGLIQPDEGSAVVNQLPRRSPRPAAPRPGFLLSSPALFAYLTGEETLIFLAEATGAHPDDARATAASLIDFFDLGEAASQVVDEYSTGMTKRLAIAAALVHRPDVLVLDEPLESLDPIIAGRLKRMIRGFAGAGGGVLLSTHLIAAVEEVCDDIIMLHEGAIVYAGTVAAALDHAERTGRRSLEALYVATVSPRDELRTMDWLLAPRTT
jgi:ABC-2 type transport system ATP-binding protein